MTRWCKLAILSDEVSQDLDTLIRFACEFQLEGIELRSLFGKAFKDLTPAELREVRSRCDDAGLAIAGCASPVFKCPVDAPAQIAEHIELFKRAVEAAQILGCDLVRVFTFLRCEHPTTADDLARAASQFPPLLELARGAGIRIGVENEASCLAGTGGETREVLRHLPAVPELGVVWDPCNVLFLDAAPDPVREDFAAVADRTIHVHVKDAQRDGRKAASTCVELGSGEVDFPAQFSALKQQGYRGWITLETHWRTVPLDAESTHLPAGDAFSANAEPASRICMANLQRLVDEAA